MELLPTLRGTHASRKCCEGPATLRRRYQLWFEAKATSRPHVGDSIYVTCGRSRAETEQFALVLGAHLWFTDAMT